ncbi:hypothetical protein QL285_033129 [Trifolium repens]|nr:hypothetical protein QL285_033129 [Trifolium repens]
MQQQNQEAILNPFSFLIHELNKHTNIQHLKLHHKPYPMELHARESKVEPNSVTLSLKPTINTPYCFTIRSSNKLQIIEQSRGFKVQHFLQIFNSVRSLVVGLVRRFQ